MTDDLTASERRVLNYLGTPSDHSCMNLNHLSAHTGLPREEVAQACRSLRKRGIAECYTGLVDEDGEFYGSGYGLSPAEIARRVGEVE